jgi:ribulose-5-phosphate 4-epimerase/fuculose-1-phosphate aldolase
VEKEGVIKYSLDFQRKTACVNDGILREMNACRSVMIEQGLLGQDDQRYGGYGFGNISIRSEKSTNTFLITGSQTGHKPLLTKSCLSNITQIDIERNKLCAHGEVEPSSESMTHGVLYQLSNQIQAVVHVHSPDIWGAAENLNLASTPKEIPYGTPEMAFAVQRLCAKLMLSNKPLPMIFVMKGHEDGVVAAGASLMECAHSLLDLLERSK